MIERAFIVEGRPQLTVSIPAGRVDIHPSRDTQVRVRVDTKDPDFIVDQSGDRITVASSRNGQRGFDKSAYVVIETPDQPDISVSTASANIDCGVPIRRGDFKTASGDVDLLGAESLVVKTASGDTTVETIGQAFRFNGASGDVRVTKSLHGSANTTSVSGDVHMENVDATVNVSTVSGDVTIVTFTGKSASLKSVSGDFEIGVLPGTKVHLDAQLRAGRVILPDTPPTVTERLREMTIKAKSVSGTLTLNRLD